MRIVSEDVAGLAQFYRAITGIAPSVCNPDYVEFRTVAGALAISSRRAMDLYGAGPCAAG